MRWRASWRVLFRLFSRFPVSFVFVASWCQGKKNCRHGERGFNALRFPLMCRRFALAVRACGSRLRFALHCASLASADLMRCDFLLCVGGSRLRFNRKRKPLFFRVSSTSLPAHKSRLMRRIDRLTVSSKSGNRRENSAQDKQNWVFRRNPPVPNRN